MSSIKTINQERADFALKKVNKISGDKSKFKTNAGRLPSLILTNGLIPTLAFLKASGDRRAVYEVLDEWLKEKGYFNNDSLEELVNSDSSKLRLATMEALEFANWLKRIAEIELKDTEDDKR